MSRVLRAERALLADGWREDVLLEVVDGRLVAVGPAAGATADEHLEGSVVPGYVDTHVHGGGGASFSTTDPDEARTVLAAHARGGTTTMMASLVTGSMETLLEQVRALAPLVRAGELAGIHLEGPFLNPDRRGAHDADLLVDPTPERVEALLAAADGTLAMVTLAPERRHGMAAVERFAAAGVRVAIGHTEADAATTARAVAAGATVATHLFNAMPAIHHREPGPVPGLLTDPGVVVELIADGTHLADEVLAMAVAAAGADRVALVTDAMSATGCADGRYVIGRLDVLVQDRVARLVDAAGTVGSIAGSTLLMGEAVQRVASLPGVDLADAVTMATRTPARAHRLGQVGSLVPGGPADLVQLDEDAGVRAVLRRGRWVTG
ncbi:N-acetylglucosamine-6-phosphate deacetylase [Auraticoccus monumenti]|uniref:N-acetylglucosamine 6-phosphate deacetylase n=1 Tax=Auraticoccus monumenti TaxID=675864 RepID=A0A1G6YGX0_9ACTN|nr:amidohydrolase family protein [Auraticoccus monumenti]SDD89659.1 N-acetylglucosamine 6-phosphate deacetylase [Auraticoccus monumenti]